MKFVRVCSAVALLAMSAGCEDDSSTRGRDHIDSGLGGIDGGFRLDGAVADGSDGSVPACTDLQSMPALRTGDVHSTALTRDGHGDVVLARVEGGTPSPHIVVERYHYDATLDACTWSVLGSAIPNVSSTAGAPISLTYDSGTDTLVIAYTQDRTPREFGTDVMIATLGSSPTADWLLTQMTTHVSTTGGAPAPNADSASFPVLAARAGTVALAYHREAPCVDLPDADDVCNEIEWVRLDLTNAAAHAFGTLPHFDASYRAVALRPAIAISPDGASIAFAWVVAIGSAVSSAPVEYDVDHGPYGGKILYWQSDWSRDTVLYQFPSPAMFEPDAKKSPSVAIAHDGTRFHVAAFVPGGIDAYAQDYRRWGTFFASRTDVAPDGVGDAWLRYEAEPEGSPIPLPRNGVYSAGGLLRMFAKPDGSLVLVGQRVDVDAFPDTLATDDGPLVYTRAAGSSSRWVLSPSLESTTRTDTDATGSGLDAVFTEGDDSLVVTYVSSPGASTPSSLDLWNGNPNATRPALTPLSACTLTDGWNEVFPRDSDRPFNGVTASAMTVDNRKQPIVAFTVASVEASGTTELYVAHLRHGAGGVTSDACAWSVQRVATYASPEVSNIDIVFNYSLGGVGVVYETMEANPAVRLTYGSLSDLSDDGLTWPNVLVSDSASQASLPSVVASGTNYKIAYLDSCALTESTMCVAWPVVGAVDAFAITPAFVRDAAQPPHTQTEHEARAGKRFGFTVLGDQTVMLAWIVDISRTIPTDDTLKILYWQSNFPTNGYEYLAVSAHTNDLEALERVGVSLWTNDGYAPVIAATFADDAFNAVPPRVLVRSRDVLVGDTATELTAPTTFGFASWRPLTDETLIADTSESGSYLRTFAGYSGDWRVVMSRAESSSNLVAPFDAGPFWLSSTDWTGATMTCSVSDASSPVSAAGSSGRHLDAETDAQGKMMISMDMNADPSPSSPLPFGTGVYIWRESEI